MITKTRKVYYCEYCKKHRHTSSGMKNHERGCTKNPNRDCRLCENEAGDLPSIIAKWKKTLELVKFHIKEKGDCLDKAPYQLCRLEVDEDNIKSSIASIVDDVAGCPICTLTVLRVLIPTQPGYRYHWFEHFDYKAKLKEWWDAVNAARASECLEAGYNY